MPKSREITRRTILAGLPAAAAAGVAALPKMADAADGPDPEILRLEAEFNTAFRAFDRALDRLAAADKVWYAQKPKAPAAEPLPPEVTETDNRMMVRIINPITPKLKALAEYRDRHEKTWSRYNAECERLKQEAGLPEAHEEERRTCDAANAAFDAVLAFPATSIADLLVKLRVHDRWDYGEQALADALADDIKRIGGVA